MVRNGMLSCKEILFFSYARKGKYAYPRKNSDRFINLDAALLKKKKKLIRDVYGFDKNSFEDICCGDAEAFNVKRLR